MPTETAPVGAPLLYGKDSTVPGYPSLQVDVARLLLCLRICEHDGVGYGLGAKAAHLEAWPPSFSEIDCSGFARYALYHATGGVLMPDGSSNQNDWAQGQGFKHQGGAQARAAYLASGGNHDNYLRLCFCRANPSERIGHVWFLYNGWTAESHGGHGPNSRPFNTPVLERIVTDVYVLGHFPPQ